MAAYYLALAIAGLGWDAGVISALPLAVLITGFFVALAVGVMGTMATVCAWLSRQGDRRLLTVSLLVNAPSALFLLYAGLKYYLAPATNS